MPEQADRRSEDRDRDEERRDTEHRKTAKESTCKKERVAGQTDVQKLLWTIEGYIIRIEWMTELELGI